MTATPVPSATPFRLLVVLSTIGWLNTQAVSDATSALVAGGTILATGYVGISTYIDRKHRDKRRQDLQDEIERMRALDAARHESLSAQLEEANARAAKMAEDSKYNQERMRATLHDINNQLNAANLENEVLRRDLTAANANFIRASEQLSAANARIADLSEEIHRLRSEVKAVYLTETSQDTKPPGRHSET